ncbi:MAG: DNA-binding LytR/AlgR family response regulator [Crocinitomicaceae bacterium]|jgi:DNA-binding LytR/AlgR family response regulator
MAVKVLIVEDEVLIAENLAADLSDLGYVIKGIAISDEECFEALDKEIPDVILMDIKIKGALNGIEVVERINKTMSIPIIYLTSNTDPLTMRKAIATKPHSFISKPYNVQDLQASIEIAFNEFNYQAVSVQKNNQSASFFVKSGELYHRVKVDEILYAEASGSYCVVNTDSGEFVLSMNLQSFFNKIAGANFVRTHRSFLVNIAKVDKFDNHSVYIEGNEIPISKSNREEVLKHLHRL